MRGYKFVVLPDVFVVHVRHSQPLGPNRGTGVYQKMRNFLLTATNCKQFALRYPVSENTTAESIQGFIRKYQYFRTHHNNNDGSSNNNNELSSLSIPSSWENCNLLVPRHRSALDCVTLEWRTMLDMPEELMTSAILPGANKEEQQGPQFITPMEEGEDSLPREDDVPLKPPSQRPSAIRKQQEREKELARERAMKEAERKLQEQALREADKQQRQIEEEEERRRKEDQQRLFKARKERDEADKDKRRQRLEKESEREIARMTGGSIVMKTRTTIRPKQHPNE